MLHHLGSLYYHAIQFRRLHTFASHANSYSHVISIMWSCILICVILCISASVLSSCDPPPPPSPRPIVTPTPRPPTSSPATPDSVKHVVEQYEVDALTDHDDAAYSMLSSDQMHRISRKQFAKDMNYTLMPGCWTIVYEDAPKLEKDGVTWEMGLVMIYVPYGSTKMYSFYWHFQVRKEHGKLVIVGIGLTGTSGGDPAKQLC